ncbi:TPA: AAA family ATPase [Providencia rettgeri]|uniref:AAA family ATPase n=1 Tax=Providencia sp. PROV129 TaxID=2949839 RepID=UPI00234BEFBA|nr:AAA family ATPase [Providencia sp. PROV129]HEC8328570.1 AAA family ATPase [Providencia rettgeri]
MKICIVGTSGVGKTTLAKKLSKEFNISLYSYDDIYWDKSGGEYHKNTQIIINSLVSNVLSQDKWIVEGAYDKRLLPFFNDSMLIIHLKKPHHVCTTRIIKRFLLARIARTQPKETWKNTCELLYFTKEFESRLEAFFALHPEFHAKKVIINRNNLCVIDIVKLFKGT